MNIAVLSAWEANGGAERATIRLLKGLRLLPDIQTSYFVGRRDISGSRAVCFTEPGKVRGLTTDVVTRLGLKNTPFFYEFDRRRNQKNVCALLEKNDPEVINLHNINQWSGIPLGHDLVESLTRIAPVVWTMHDMWPLTGKTDYTRKTVYGQADAPGESSEWPQEAIDRINRLKENLTLVAPSMWLKELAQNTLDDDFRTIHIPYGIDTDFFYPIDQIAAKKVLGLDLNRRYVLSLASNLDALRKGGEVLIQMMNRLKSIEWITVGDRRNSLTRWPGNVLHMGSIKDDRLLRIVYSAVDVLVIPSLADNLPNVVLEAMACGTPTVGFRTGGIPDMIREGKTGLLAEHGDAQDLSEKLKEMLHLSHQHHEQVRRDCVNRARESYSLMKQAVAYADLFTKLKS